MQWNGISAHEPASGGYGGRQVRTQQLRKFIGDNRFLEIVALSFGAVLRLQGYKLFPRFHSLRDDLEIETAPQINHRTDQFRVIGVRANAAQKQDLREESALTKSKLT